AQPRDRSRMPLIVLLLCDARPVAGRPDLCGVDVCLAGHYSTHVKWAALQMPASFPGVRNQTLAAILRRINDSVPFRSRSDLAPFVNRKGDAASPIHRWLRYREAYSPDLITRLSLGDRILDPFCGCGSTLLGASRWGSISVGIDINPLAIFAARVKLT